MSTLLLNPHAVRQQPIDAPKIARKMCGKCATIDAGEYDEQKATNRRKKIIADKMSAICPLFQQDAYNEHAGHARLRQSHQVKENDRSNRRKKIR